MVGIVVVHDIEAAAPALLVRISVVILYYFLSHETLICDLRLCRRDLVLSGLLLRFLSLATLLVAVNCCWSVVHSLRWVVPLEAVDAGVALGFAVDAVSEVVGVHVEVVLLLLLWHYYLTTN